MYRTRRNQWQALTAHQSKREEEGYGIQESISTLAIEENCKIFDGGMIKDRVENTDMTVYARTNSGKTISIKCDRRQCDKKNGNSRKKDVDTERPALPREPRKSIERQEKQKEESNIEAGAKIEMSWKG